jgi:hypothetical protein
MPVVDQVDSVAVQPDAPGIGAQSSWIDHVGRRAPFLEQFGKGLHFGEQELRFRILVEDDDAARSSQRSAAETGHLGSEGFQKGTPQPTGGLAGGLQRGEMGQSGQQTAAGVGIDLDEPRPVGGQVKIVAHHDRVVTGVEAGRLRHPGQHQFPVGRQPAEKEQGPHGTQHDAQIPAQAGPRSDR